MFGRQEKSLMKRTGILFILLLVSFSYSQDFKRLKSQLTEIDSLVFNQNIEKAEYALNILIDKKNEIILEQDINKISGRLIEYFETLLQNIHNIDTNDPAFNESLVISYRQYRHFYSDNRSGELAEKAFDKFLTLSDSLQITKSLKFYQIAHFLRKIFLERSLLQAVETYNQANNYYHSNRIEDATKSIESFNYVSEPNKYLAEMQDSLSCLKSKINDIRKYQERENHFWNRDINPHYNLSIILGINLFHQNSVEERYLEYDLNGNSSDILVQKIPDNQRTGYSAALEYLLKERYILGAEVTTNRFTFTSTSDQQLIFFDYDINCLSFNLNFKYLLRSYVGLQPFVGLGTGLTNYKRDKSTLILVETSDDSIPIYNYHYYKIRESNLTNVHILFDLGIQYVQDYDSHFSLGFKYTLYHNVKYFDFVNRYNHYLTAYLRTSF